VVPAEVVAAQEKGQVGLVSSSATDAVIDGTNYRVLLRFTPDPQMSLSARLQGEKYEALGTFPLEGLAEATLAAQAKREGSATFEDRTISRDAEGYQVQVRYSSALWKRKEILLRFQPTFFALSMRLEGSSKEQKLQSVYYLARSSADSGLESGQGTFEELSTWTPDLYHVLLPEKGESNVALSSVGPAAEPGYVRGHFAGSPLVPPYVAALRSGSAWWGVGTLGVPRSRYGLRLLLSRNSLAVAFDMGAVVSAGDEGVEAPQVGFFFGKNAQDILSAYRTVLNFHVPDMPPKISKWQAWWSGPIYCTWGDQAYTQRIKEGRLDETNGSRYATEENVQRWLDIANKEQLPVRTVILDLGWLLAYGDLEPNPRHFPDMRKFVDRLHSKGLHVLLWIPMYEASGSLFNLDQAASHVAADHPEWLIHTRDGKATDLFDYTHPEVREYIRSRLHHLLSSDPGCLNADGVKVDFMSRVPDPAVSVFYDPSWATGELMNYEVLKLIYQSAKQAKTDALVDSSFMNPLFQEWQDIIRLSDDVSNSRDTYWQRAWAAALNGVRAIDGDDWWAMDSYFVPLTLAKAAWGIPQIYALEYRGAQGSAGPISGVEGIASGGYPVAISQGDYRRVSSILNVYLHAPADNTQTPFVDPELRLAYRTYGDGPLKGFYAARTLSFGHALATYTSREAWVTSNVDGDVAVPLPAGYAVTDVLAVDFDGQEKSVRFHEDAKAVQFAVRDSARGTNRYVVKYRRTAPEKFGNQQ
jgi:hypothetical protein